MALTTKEKWQEIANRGLQDRFDPVTRSKFDEAVKRGLITLPSQEFSAMQTVKNIPSSAVKFGKDITYPFLHPVDTAKGLGNLAMGVTEKAIPGEQQHEVYADQVGQFIKDRYGSLDAAKQTLMNDPVGMLADMSLAVTGGSMLIPKVGKLGKISNVAKTTGMAIDPLNIVLNTGKYAAGKLTPAKLPASMYESAAKFRTGLDKKTRMRITDTALNENIMPTQAGIDKLNNIVDGLNNKVNELIDTATTKGVSVQKEQLYQHLHELQKNVGGVKVNAPKDLRIINTYVDAMDQYLDDIGKNTLTPRDLQDFKVDAYKAIDFDRSNLKSIRAIEEANKAMAKAAKAELEKIYPEIKDLNAREGRLLEARPELERSASRIGNLNVVSLDPMVKAGAGGVVGGAPGGLLGGGLSVLDMPRPKAKLALMLKQAQNQGLLGYFDNNLENLMARQGLLQSGRLGQQ